MLTAEQLSETGYIVYQSTALTLEMPSQPIPSLPEYHHHLIMGK